MMLTKGSIKTRLIGGFFLCAVLTALSGGTGIFSLNKIQIMMGRTTRLVSDNTDSQHRQIQHLMPIRTLVSQTLGAETAAQAAPLLARWQELSGKAGGTDEDPQAFRAIFSQTRELIDTKTLQIKAQGLLIESLEQTLDILEKITRLTKLSARETQDASVRTVEKELENLSLRIGGSAGHAAISLSDTLDELMMTSEMSISAVRAALAVQTVTVRQQVLTNALYHAGDFDALDQIRQEILSLQGNLNSELVELPDDQTTRDLTRALTSFSTLVQGMFDKKREELGAREALGQKAELITRAIVDVELALMEASRQVKTNVDKAMADSGAVIRNWQSVQVALAAAAMALALGIGFLSVSLIIRPIMKIIDMLKDIAQGEGNLTARLDAGGKDEIAEMARWFNLFVEKIQAMIQAIAGNTRHLETGASTLLSLAGTLSQGAARTSATAETVLASAEETSRSMEAMDRQGLDASDSIQSISAAVEQMTISVDDIARTAAASGQISEKAVDASQRVLDQVARLNLSARDIGTVTQVIRDISGQTHLLALNATIEAARAGEAGKGFTVVANEIKELANQTTDAITEIKEKVDAIQSSAQVMDQGIGEVSGTISQTNEAMASIVSAVEEQSATTKEIAEKLALASQGISTISDHVSSSSQVSQDIAREVAQVSRTAETIHQDSTRVRDNAGELTRLAATLKSQAAQFTV